MTEKQEVKQEVKQEEKKEEKQEEKQEEKKLSKKEIKRRRRQERKKQQQLEKQRKREERERQEKERLKKLIESLSPDRGLPEIGIVENYGAYGIVSSKWKTERVWTSIKDLSPKMEGQEVWIRGRVHTTGGRGKIAFTVVREKYFAVQCVTFIEGDIIKPMINYISKIPNESTVDVQGTITIPNEKVQRDVVTQNDIELKVRRLYVVDECLDHPISVPNCMTKITDPKWNEKYQVLDKKLKLNKEKEEEKQKEEEQEKEKETEKKKGNEKKNITVGLDQRLDYRVVSLRTPTNQAIFKIQAGIQFLFRQFLDQRKFTEIHSPKLIGIASEGGSDVFEVGYFKEKAYLAQSPQLYKQMAVLSGFDRVFEIGPVFRAEKSNTYRHLTEFVGLDLEMAFKEHYHEVLDLIGEMFTHIFTTLQEKFKKEIEIISKQFEYNPITIKTPVVRITYKEAVNMLNEAGLEQEHLKDLSTENERALGKLMKKKYETDFYIVDKFPSSFRPFYTFLDPNDKNYTHSYDVFLRGEEIASGAQRIHNSEMLEKRAKELDFELDQIRSYSECFKYGSVPHAGAGFGLERIVMLFLGLPNIRQASLFPRDPCRLDP
ncbi:aspartyl-tRNA synthetase [Anaeramoeba flamelloides]|uniref:aspartate--tRNA ligase n=1 Tax=Anaeramoeba flamelloides TaxID=1746091 RepID=A0AAV7ZY79_9EUKA|nr:aspartyl-tRNA synthetase [Anaeramoeba flamelloides]